MVAIAGTFVASSGHVLLKEGTRLIEEVGSMYKRVSLAAELTNCQESVVSPLDKVMDDGGGVTVKSEVSHAALARCISKAEVVAEASVDNFMVSSLLIIKVS